MPKAYWIARVDVHDPEEYKHYVAKAKSAFERHNAKFLVRGGAYDELEGTARSRNVVIEFESMEKARACYHDPEYQEAMKHRKAAAENELVLVEGYDG